MAAKDLERLENLLLQALLDREIEDQLLNSRARIEWLEEASLSQDAIKILMGIDAESLREFAVRSREALDSRAISEVDEETSKSNYETSAPVILRTNLNYPDMSLRLAQRGFTPAFGRMFNRLLTTRIGKPSQDFFVIYFDKEIAVEDIVNIINPLDVLFKQFIAEMYPDEFHSVTKIEPRILRIREYKVESWNAVIDIASQISDLEPYLELLLSELITFLDTNDYAQELFLSFVYDLLKASVGVGFGFIFGRTTDRGDVILSDDSSIDEPKLARAKQRLGIPDQTYELVQTVQDQNFIQIGKYRILTWGAEKRTIIRTNDPNMQLESNLNSIEDHD